MRSSVWSMLLRLHFCIYTGAQAYRIPNLNPPKKIPQVLHAGRVRDGVGASADIIRINAGGIKKRTPEETVSMALNLLL